MIDHVNARIGNAPCTGCRKANSLGNTKDHVKHTAMGETQHTRTGMGREESGHTALNTSKEIIEALAARRPKVWITACPTTRSLWKQKRHLCVADPLQFAKVTLS